MLPQGDNSFHINMHRRTSEPITAAAQLTRQSYVQDLRAKWQIHHPWRDLKTSRCSTWGHGSVVDLTVLG